jgi:hypothetical protein
MLSASGREFVNGIGRTRPINGFGQPTDECLDVAIGNRTQSKDDPSLAGGLAIEKGKGRDAQSEACRASLEGLFVKLFDKLQCEVETSGGFDRSCLPDVCAAGVKRDRHAPCVH